MHIDRTYNERNQRRKLRQALGLHFARLDVPGAIVVHLIEHGFITGAESENPELLGSALMRFVEQKINVVTRRVI